MENIKHLRVNISEKEVFVVIDNQFIPILDKKSKSSNKVYKLKKETIDQLINIINKKKTNQNKKIVKEQAQLKLKLDLQKMIEDHKVQ